MALAATFARPRSVPAKTPYRKRSTRQRGPSLGQCHPWSTPRALLSANHTRRLASRAAASVTTVWIAMLRNATDTSHRGPGSTSMTEGIEHHPHGTRTHRGNEVVLGQLHGVVRAALRRRAQGRYVLLGKCGGWEHRGQRGHERRGLK